MNDRKKALTSSWRNDVIQRVGAITNMSHNDISSSVIETAAALRQRTMIAQQHVERLVAAIDSGDEISIKSATQNANEHLSHSREASQTLNDFYLYCDTRDEFALIERESQKLEQELKSEISSANNTSVDVDEDCA